MGLLSGMQTTKRQKILQSLAKHEWWIGILTLMIGVALFIALAHDSLNARLYVDENALMPGIASENFRGGNEAAKLAEEWERLTTRDEAIVWLSDKLTQIGVEVYQQNFTVLLPFPDFQQQQMISSTNVYGILRAPRGASVESIVLSSPCRLLTDGLNVQPSHYGVALLVSLAKHFRRK
jgi:glycosylphosphatidylinositol transamidase